MINHKSFKRVLSVVMCIAMLMISAFATVTTVSAARTGNYTVTMLQSVGGTASYSSATEPVVSGDVYTDVVRLTASPDANYKFDHWVIDGPYRILTDRMGYGTSLTDDKIAIMTGGNITVTPYYVANNTANVKYSVEPTYMVNIPATVSLNSSTTISAENVVLEKGKQVEVAIASTSEDDNSFKLKSAEGAEIEYTIKNNGSAVSLNDKVLIVNSDSSSTGDSTLSFVAPSGVTYAGSYTGTVTFNVAVGIA